MANTQKDQQDQKKETLSGSQKSEGQESKESKKTEAKKSEEFSDGKFKTTISPENDKHFDEMVIREIMHQKGVSHSEALRILNAHHK